MHKYENNSVIKMSVWAFFWEEKHVANKCWRVDVNTRLVYTSKLNSRFGGCEYFAFFEFRCTSLVDKAYCIIYI